MNEKLRLVIGSAACGILLSSAPSLVAQVDEPSARAGEEESAIGDPQTWGTASNSIYNLGPDDFSVRLAGWNNAYLLNNAQIRPNLTGTMYLSGPVHLPAGALVKSFTVFYMDNNTTSDPFAVFYGASTTGGLTPLQVMNFPVFSNGDTSFTVTLPAPGVAIDNLANHYGFSIELTRSATAGQFHALYRVRIAYALQVSPAPATATFLDVPTSDPRFRFVEALVASGLTGGCGGGNFCPNTAVTRGQLAVFLAGALGLHFPN